MTKYKARPTVIGMTRYASKKEADYCEGLKLLERAGKIRNLTLQPKFPFMVEGVKVGTYIADAAYFEDNKRVVIDVKGYKTPLYRFKKRLLLALYPGLDHREI